MRVQALLPLWATPAPREPPVAGSSAVPVTHTSGPVSPFSWV